MTRSLKTPCWIMIGWTKDKKNVKALRFKTGALHSHNLEKAAKRLNCPNVSIYRVRLGISRWQHPTFYMDVLFEGKPV